MNFFRLLFFVLLAINSVLVLLMLAAPKDTLEGVSESLKKQLNPEKIVLSSDAAQPQNKVSRPAAPAAPVTPNPTPVPPPAPAQTAVAVEAPANGSGGSVCVALIGLNTTQVTDLENQIRVLGPNYESREIAVLGPSGWWVMVPPAYSRDAAERKLAQLDALGVRDRYIVTEIGPNQNAISLGWFRSETAARKHLTGLQAKGVTEAKLVQQESNGQDIRMELQGPKEGLQRLVDVWLLKHGGTDKTSCGQG